MVDGLALWGMVQGTAIKEFAKLAIKILWNGISKDGKLNLRRIIIAAFLFLIGWGFYVFPDMLILLSKHVTFNIDSSIYLFFSDMVKNTLKNPHYHHLLKSLFLTFYLFLGVSITAYLTWKKNQKYEDGYAELVKLKNFATAVSFVGGVRPINEGGKTELKGRIEKAIRNSSSINLMLINGSSIFSSQDDPLLQSINECRGKSIKVLLLDPFSKYAVDRARSMTHALGSEGGDAIKKYISDFNATKSRIDALKASEWGKSNSIELRCHCSRPYFRFYIFGGDAFIQTYANAYDGHKSPVYHVKKDESAHYNSLYSVASDMFNFHWDRGFNYDDSSSIKGVLPIYLAKMHEIPIDDYIQNVDELRLKIADDAKEKLEAAKN